MAPSRLPGLWPCQQVSAAYLSSGPGSVRAMGSSRRASPWPCRRCWPRTCRANPGCWAATRARWRPLRGWCPRGQTCCPPSYRRRAARCVAVAGPGLHRRQGALRALCVLHACRCHSACMCVCDTVRPSFPAGLLRTGMLQRASFHRPGKCGLVRELHPVCHFELLLPPYARCGEQARL